MHVPEVKKCCFCCSLRWGIISFAYINLIFSVVTSAFLIMKSDFMNLTFNRESTLEIVASTLLFQILGMGVILNTLLLVAGYKKNIAMMRLYNFYALITTLAALIPTFGLVSHMHIVEFVTLLIVIAVQVYVIVLVRSEIVKIEAREAGQERVEVAIDVPDRDTLM